jgi:mRNA interferase MazF
VKKKYVPRRGDIVRMNFDPQLGREQAGRRPALVLSSAAYNRPSGLVIVCPITNEEKGYPFEVKIPENDWVSGVILADHLKSLDWAERKVEFVCTLAPELLEDVVQRVLAIVGPEDED